MQELTVAHDDASVLKLRVLLSAHVVENAKATPI
jgi:hypothetical protein